MSAAVCSPEICDEEDEVTGRGDLTSIGDLVDQVLGKLARADIAPIVDLRRNWAAVAGEWAARCRPVGLSGGVLTVEVASGVDASKLRFGANDLVAGVRRHLGEDHQVNRLHIRVARTGGPR